MPIPYIARSRVFNGDIIHAITSLTASLKSKNSLQIEKGGHELVLPSPRSVMEEQCVRMFFSHNWQVKTSRRWQEPIFRIIQHRRFWLYIDGIVLPVLGFKHRSYGQDLNSLKLSPNGSPLGPTFSSKPSPPLAGSPLPLTMFASIWWPFHT